MQIARIIGWLLLVLAFFVFGRDIVVGYLSGDFAFMPIGQLWTTLDPSGPAIVAGVVEHFYMPELWIKGYAIFLSLWVAPTFTAVGLVLIWSTRPLKGRDAARARQRLTRPPS